MRTRLGAAVRSTRLAWATLALALALSAVLHSTLDAHTLSVAILPIIYIVFTGGPRAGMVAAGITGVGAVLLFFADPHDRGAGEVATSVNFMLVAAVTGALVSWQRVEARAAAVGLERVEEERRAIVERERRLAYLANLGDVLAAPVDDADILDRVVAFMVPQLGDSGVIILRGEPAEVLLNRFAVAPPIDRAALVESLRAGPTSNADMWGIDAVLRTGQALVVEDASSSLAARPPHDTWRQRLEIAAVTSLLLEPLMVRGETIGVLTIATNAGSGRRLGPEEVWLARETARRPAVALDNARLFRQAREEIAERTRAEADLRLLADLAGAMTADLPIPELVAHLARWLAAYFDLQRIVLADLAPFGLGAFDCRVPLAAPMEITTVGVAALLPADDARLVELRRGEPLVTPVRIDLPVLRDGELVAVAWIEARAPREWRATDISLLASIVDRAWLEFENSLFVDRTMSALADREEALRAAIASEARFRSLFESTADAVIVIGGDGRVRDANPAALVLFGATREEMLTSVPLTHETAPGATEAAIAAACKTGEWSGELGFVRRSGGVITVEALLRPLAGAEEGQLVAAVRDVSERVTFEAIRQDLFAAVAHDLKNPLSSIKATAQGLRRQAARGTVDPARLEEGLRRVDSVVERMVRQIDDLEDAARLDSGRLLDLDLAPVDLLDLAREVIEQYQPTTERHRLMLVADAPTLVGRWDARRVRRVIENLVSNAIKYSPDGGDVTLIARQSRSVTGGEAMAELEVLDEGIGIANVELPHVFQRFWRSRGAGMRMAGAGIGLVGARQIVVQHGGTVTVRKREGIGSSFTVRLPLPSPGDPLA